MAQGEYNVEALILCMTQIGSMFLEKHNSKIMVFEVRTACNSSKKAHSVSVNDTSLPLIMATRWHFMFFMSLYSDIKINLIYSIKGALLKIWQFWVMPLLKQMSEIAMTLFCSWDSIDPAVKVY